MSSVQPIDDAIVAFAGVEVRAARLAIELDAAVWNMAADMSTQPGHEAAGILRCAWVRTHLAAVAAMKRHRKSPSEMGLPLPPSAIEEIDALMDEVTAARSAYYAEVDPT